MPGRGPDKQDCLSERVRTRFPDACIVHRLDMATSGLMVMARGIDAQRALQRQFEQRAVQKRYEALVHGCPQAPADGWRVIDLPIAPDWPRRPLRIVDPERGQSACTRLRVLGSAGPGRWRVALEPVTGRTHQLRVHLQAIGHPIVGDALYGVADGATRLHLHATALALCHPFDGTPLAWQSPAPF